MEAGYVARHSNKRALVANLHLHIFSLISKGVLHQNVAKFRCSYDDRGIVTLIVLGRKGPHGFPFRRPHSRFPIH